MKKLLLGGCLAAALALAGCDQGVGGSSGLTLRGTVTISEMARVGQTLEADVSGLEVPEGTTSGLYQYEWQKKGSDEDAEWDALNSATDEGNMGSYTPVDGDIGSNIRVVVSVTGYRNSIASNETSPVTPAGSGGITYTATADGVNNVTTSTKIDFDFNATVPGLEASDITITNGTGTNGGAVEKGGITGSGTNWSLAITVETAGNVKVRINKEGIVSTEKPVTVFKEGTLTVITYAAAADGDATKTSTKIDFTFGAALTGLTATDITITNGTGAVTKGNLTGNGQSRLLAITVTTAGNVKVKIEKAGIENTEKTVTVYKASDPPPAPEEAIALNKGDTRQFTTDLEGAAWAVEGVEEDTDAGTSISDAGLLTVSAAEPNITLSVTATSGEEVERYLVKVKGWKMVDLTTLFVTGDKGVIYGMAYGSVKGGGKWVAVGTTGKIAYSSNGVKWDAVASPVNLDLLRVIYDGPAGGKKFIATGEKGTIIYSNDGETWSIATVTNPSTSRYITGIAYGNDKFIAIDYGSNTNSVGVLISSNGTEWTRTSVTPPGTVGSGNGHISSPNITFGNGVFVSTLGPYGRIMKSSDGQTWTLAAHGYSSDVQGYPAGTNLVKGSGLFKIIFAESKFIALGKEGRIVMSTDASATSWTVAQFAQNSITADPASFSSTDIGLVYADGKYVATAPTGTSETRKLMYASSITGNGTVGWTILDVMGELGETLDTPVAYGDGKFMAAGTVRVGEVLKSGIVIAHEETLD
jgi:hypothetical protein